MPWKEVSIVKERLRFVMEYTSGAYGMSELCELYDISRPTGYKWVGRFAGQGAPGLENASKAHGYIHF